MSVLKLTLFKMFTNGSFFHEHFHRCLWSLSWIPPLQSLHLGGGGQADRQMHAVLLRLSKNVPILLLKDVSWEPGPGKPEWWVTLVVGSSTALNNLILFLISGFWSFTPLGL